MNFIILELIILQVGRYNVSYDQNYNYQLRKTQYIELNHTDDKLNITLSSNTDEGSYNEQYLFRNVQIFVKKCYKTCKTCGDDQFNSCKSCYNDQLTNNNVCPTCFQRETEKFLLIPQGCVAECPDGYNYDLDYVCYLDNRLKLCKSLTQLNLIDKIISCDLEQSVIELRLRFTMMNNLMNPLLLYFENSYVASIINSKIISQSKSKANIQKLQNNQIRIEVQAPINLNKLNIEINFNQQISISDVKIEYMICTEGCLQCMNEEICLFCNSTTYNFEGRCVEICPNYTIIRDKTCYNFNPSLYSYNNLNIQYVLSEFYDLSTTNDSIKELFELDSSNSTMDIHNFQKGQDIFFSYLPNKRIFGGPFVWVNARFKFKLKLSSQRQIIIVKFELLQGDYNYFNNNFHYQIDNMEKQTIILSQNNNNMNDQNWDLTQIKQQKTFINQSTFFEEQNNNNMIIFFHCENNDQNSNYSFCSIENLFIVSLTCQNSQQLDLYNYYNNQNPCISYCGDGLISSNEEECDDGNLQPFDGCFNCRFQCNEQCTMCLKGLCLECKNGYYLNEINNTCETECGDSIIEGLEQCDDGNQDNYDGCSQCLLTDFQKCDLEENQQLHKCSFCYFGRCLQCVDGYILDDGICVSFCGDGIVNKLDEECDNSDDIGCIDCRIQKDYVCTQVALSTCKTCGDYCTSCKTFKTFDVICESCQAGYYPINDKCYQCDSNCLTCLKQPFLCTSCFRDDCQTCETVLGLYADLKTKQCISQCGDGIAVKYYEQCDDGNIENGDGCDQFCQFEFDDSQFQDLSQWSLSKQNTYDLKLINSSNYNLSLLCDTSEISINNFTINEFSYNQTEVDGMCKIEFVFLKNIYTYNTIQITIQINVATTRLLTENNKPNIVYKISPQEQLILSEQQKKQSESFKVIQQSFSLIFIILIPISIITNLFDYLWSVLEILSWINNFYFINVQYPYNVEIVFLNSDWSSLINFPTYQGFNQPDCDYYFQAPTRFQNKGIDPLFINNAQVPFMFILTSIAFYIINYIFLCFFNYLNVLLSKQYQINQKHFSIFNLQAIKQSKQTQISNQQRNQVKIENNKILQIIVNLLSKNSNQFKNKIKQTISLCLLDITLACMLQFTYSKPEQHFIVAINQLLACLSIGLIIFQLSQSYSLLRIHKLLAENEVFKEKYEIYYENINTDDCFGYYYNLIGLLKKIFYVFFMVLFYFIPILQALFCFISTSIGFALICYKNPYTTKSQYVLQLILDLNLSLINFIIVIFSFNDSSNYHYIKNNIEILGWIIISLIIFSILLEICSLIYGILKYFYQIVLILKSFYKKTDLNKEKTIDQSLSIQEQKQTRQQGQFMDTKNQQRIIFIPN